MPEDTFLLCQIQKGTVEGLIGGNQTLSKEIIYNGFTNATNIQNEDYDDMLDIGYYFMHNNCTNYPPSGSSNNWHFLRVTRWSKNSTNQLLQEAFPFGSTPSMWVRYRIDGNFTSWKKVY